MAIVGALLKECIRKLPRTLLTSDSLQLMPQHMERVHTDPACPAPQDIRVEASEEGEGQRGLRPTAACEQSKGNSCRFLHRQQIRDGSDVPLRPTCT